MAKEEITLSGFAVRVMPHGEGEGKTLMINAGSPIAAKDYLLPMSEELVKRLLMDLALTNEDLIAEIEREQNETN